MNAPITSFEAVIQLSDLTNIVNGLSLKELCEGVKSPGHPDRIGSYQYTHSGGLFFPCDPRPEEVFHRDIARGVSCQYRFNGQTITRVTVAEHLVITSHNGPPETALERLMHDSPEGYISDMIRPMKVIPIFAPIYLKMEDGIMGAVAERYKLIYPFTPDIRKADESACNAEVKYNIGSQATNHLTDPTAGIDESPIYYWSSELAEKMWIARFLDLTKERGIEPF